MEELHGLLCFINKLPNLGSDEVPGGVCLLLKVIRFHVRVQLLEDLAKIGKRIL